METKMEKDYTLITNLRELTKFVDQHANADWIAFDTEFTAEYTYETQLCLIQVASPFGNYIIDCLKMDDISQFTTLLIDGGIQKITHSGANDYQIFYDKYQVVPKNVFDTQIAKSLVSTHSHLGLARLIEAELDFKLEKGLAVSSWDKRPLKDEQLRYALDDVLYLKLLKESLETRLIEMDRLGWAENEMGRLELSGSYYRDILETVIHRSWARALDDCKKAFLVKIMFWREEEARVLNKPVNYIMKIDHVGEFLKVLLEHLLVCEQNLAALAHGRL